MASNLGLFAAFAALALVSTAGATKVLKCKESKSPQLADGEITISACKGPPCTLKKKTEPSVHIKLKPEKDVKEIVTSASAAIAGIPFPFIGVDGTSACPNIYSEDGKTKLGCPLKAGETYLYKNSFKILELYPKIRVNIHWALVNSANRDELICFELPAQIT